MTSQRESPRAVDTLRCAGETRTGWEEGLRIPSVASAGGPDTPPQPVSSSLCPPPTERKSVPPQEVPGNAGPPRRTPEARLDEAIEIPALPLCSAYGGCVLG